ncbi:uncharacterized protein E0L32_009817 [Thyridium curvatum]|uniref:Ubiquitin-like domain-containing protein n=1 Tax=Thyridium curvatum TaxID=1093900 RepID=A0A507AGB9_9PEZI|nr:uncharacterized protein E0L32_009817 [Thyridium curvatum]TPX08755.1 hypothetical protein E0L32_009817 [Thyridium curvatum]
MAEPTVPSPAQAGDEQPLAVDLRIVSPSQGVPNPLVIADLPAATTVGGLKDRLRSSLVGGGNHQDVQLRLIHRGRVLDHDQASLERIFGAASVRTTSPIATRSWEELLTSFLFQIRESKAQTLHLVLRDTSSQPSSHPAPPAPQASTATPSPGPANNAQQQPHPPHAHPAHAHVHIHGLPGAQNMNARFTLGGQTPPATQQSPFAVPQQPGQAHPNLPPAFLAQQQQILAQQQHMMQNAMGWMNQLHRQPNLGPLLNQHQRERAAMGFNGIHDPARNAQAGQADNTGRNSPAGQPSHHTVVREGVLPNGSWRITVDGSVIGPQGPLMNTQANQARQSPGPGLGQQPQHAHVHNTTQPPRGPLSVGDVQNILRGADANQAAQIMTNAMHRSASGASLSGMANGPMPFGVTVPAGLRPGHHYGIRSRTATPDLLVTPTQAMSSALSRAQATSGRPEVYILSSPSGPRALLINNNAEAFYTPAVRAAPAPAVHVQVHPATSPLMAVHAPQPPQRAGTPHPANDIVEQWRQNAEQQHAAQQLAQAQAQEGQQQQQAAMPPLGPPLQVNNPGAGAIAAMWPHIWLLIRMAVVIWCFTSPHWSWTRWSLVIGLATIVFIFNTGLLDNFAPQALGPFRRHLEGLLPMVDNHGRPRNPQDPNAPLAPGQAGGGVGAAAGAGAGDGAARADRQPDPREAAERMVARHRVDNANWLMNQVRRAERAGLLFLASIAPGVAERHIANLEAQEREERERREAEERRRAEEAAAAAAAAATAAAGENAGGEGQDQGQEKSAEAVSQSAENGERAGAGASGEAGAVSGQQPSAPREGALVDV